MITTPDHSDAATSVPAMEPVGPRPQGFWLDCDPSTGTAGTRFRAEEFNELALNLRRFLAASGVLPVKGSPDMLLASLNRLFAGKVTAVVATQTLTADNAGLVVIDATAGDVTLTLPDASVLPAGSPAFSFVRADSTTRIVRIVPVAGDVIRGGVVVLESEPAIIRSDGASTWWPLSRLGAPIKRAVTLNVSPSGVVEPADPMGGDAFNELGSAIAWLAQRLIISPGTVTIQVAAGTYTRTSQIDLGHPNGDRIAILGAGSVTTILQFNGSNGLYVRNPIQSIGALTLRGNAAGIGVGIMLALTEMALADDLVVDNFAASGVYVSGVITCGPAGQVTIKNCLGAGLNVAPGGSVTFHTNAKLVLTNNGASLANLFGETGASMRIVELTSTGSARGIWLANRASAIIGQLSVIDATSTPDAVRVENGSFLGCDTDGRAWVARNAASTVFYVFLAQEFGQIDTRNALHASNKTLTNPTQNTIGNTQSYISTR